MKQDKKLLDHVKSLMLARYPSFGAEIASAKLLFDKNLRYHTAATDGKNILFDPDYLASLNDDDKLFIIAHELMHIKFEHMFRVKDENGNKRNKELWNIATDAVINANLEKDGFKIKDGYVNMPEAINFTSEEFYDKLFKEQQAKQNGQQNQQGQQSQSGHQNQQGQQSQSGQQNQQGQGGQNGENSGRNEQFADDHTLWEKANEERKQQKDKNQSGQQNQQGQQNQSGQRQESKTGGYFNDSNFTSKKAEDLDKQEFNEKEQFAKNREERHEIAKQMMEKMQDEALKSSESSSVEFGNIGEAKPVLDWKLVLRREVEKTETIWSQRRSIAENNYAYRLEENDVEDEAETEVMVDVSGSVSTEMVKAFLRQLKPILKASKLKVGFFADFATKEFQEIKSDRDIDKLKIYTPGFGTNMDAAVRAFSKKREVNKIVFTDGYPGEMPGLDLKGVNVIWLVYENRDFHPCCGKVIDIYPKDIYNLMKSIKRKPDEFMP